MFTGIITDIGRVAAVEPGAVTRFTIATAYDTGAIAIGASIACSGPCLTVVATTPGHFAVEAVNETLARTTAGAWRVGTPLNLERALKAGDELGGHIVSGHVDGVAEIVDIQPDGDSLRFTLVAPADLARYIAPKGSVTLDGVSLTVTTVSNDRFGVAIIPHTRAHTTVGGWSIGDRVNLEVDMLARYVARLKEQG